jgi:prevent-host-death family protein
MIQMQAAEAKTHFLKLLTQVENGEIVSITRHGKPVATLSPIVEKPRKSSEEVIAAFREFRKSIKTVPMEEIVTDVRAMRDSR